MFLGIDLGTSSVKALLVDDDERLVAEASAPLEVSRPRPLWSEQDPEDWWSAALSAVDSLRDAAPGALSATRALGLSGQMHGATLLDAADAVLRPAILWNDGRSSAECAELTARAPSLEQVTGNRAMPGFTAPKLLWVARHEPELFARTARVLLPKDFLRLRLTGERATDASDAAGTLWLDVAARRWSPELLAATGLSLDAMPRVVEGTEPSGQLRAELRARWGMASPVVVAGGAGDNAASAVGLGLTRPGDAFLSLGTSGVYFVVTPRFAPAPASGVHAFCHAVPGRWHQMAVMLSAASALSFLAETLGESPAALTAPLAAVDVPSPVTFLPYLSGERTPHDDPLARGVLFGLGHETSRRDLAQAVLEGVAFGLADGEAALREAGAEIDRVSLVGGGAQSAAWGRILASVLGRPLELPSRAELGAALGAARLGRAALVGGGAAAIAAPAAPTRVIEPDAALSARYAPRLSQFRRLYRALRAEFRSTGVST